MEGSSSGPRNVFFAMSELELPPPSTAWQERLIDAALAARDLAYVPYSNFRVGAAILTQGQQMYVGANIENASYGLTMCAERVAMSTAVMHDDAELIALTVASPGGCSPCGACRQFLFEFSRHAWIYLVDSESRKLCGRHRLHDLLPFGFCGDVLPPPGR